jgi:predicted short-subunit dehydrogenase-like oxidoreductase (DUF2520 family)
VGTAVAKTLVGSGHEAVAVASPSSTSIDRATSLLGARRFGLDEEVPPCDVILLGVPGPVLSEVAEKLAARDVRGKVAWHLSGAVGIDALRPLAEAGAYTVALHPVQACPDLETALRRLPGSAWGVTSQDDLADWAFRVVRDGLEGSPVVVQEEDRALWHAAAATVSNGIAGLMAAGEAMLASIGVTAPEKVLGPLAAGTVQNASEGGGGAATLTGPVVRGDSATVAHHLEAITDPSHRNAYRHAALVILEQAKASGRLDGERASALLDALREAQ